MFEVLTVLIESILGFIYSVTTVIVFYANAQKPCKNPMFWRIYDGDVRWILLKVDGYDCSIVC